MNIATNIKHIDEAQARTDPKLNPHFQGEARMQHLFDPATGNGNMIMLVTFSAGGRTYPHTHKQGQILYITDGRGFVAIDSEKREVTAGDIVVIPPGAWHWHGATPDSPMSHIAIQGPEGDLSWDVEMRDWASNY